MTKKNMTGVLYMENINVKVLFVHKNWNILWLDRSSKVIFLFSMSTKLLMENMFLLIPQIRVLALVLNTEIS